MLVLVGCFAAFFWQHSLRIHAEGVTGWTESRKADCGIVLTGGPGRVREGLALLQRGQVGTLIVSGVYPHTNLYDLVLPWDRIWNFSEDKIVLEKNSRTTFGNAAQTLPLVEALRCRDVLLITSTIHMYRSFQTFSALYPEELQIIKYGIPSSQAESSMIGFATEVLKSIFYSIWAYP